MNFTIEMGIGNRKKVIRNKGKNLLIFQKTL